MHLFVIWALSSFDEHVYASLYAMIWNDEYDLFDAYVFALIWYVHVSALDGIIWYIYIYEMYARVYDVMKCHDRCMLGFVMKCHVVCLDVWCVCVCVFKMQCWMCFS